MAVLKILVLRNLLLKVKLPLALTAKPESADAFSQNPMINHFSQCLDHLCLTRMDYQNAEAMQELQKRSGGQADFLRGLVVTYPIITKGFNHLGQFLGCRGFDEVRISAQAVSGIDVGILARSR